MATRQRRLLGRRGSTEPSSRALGRPADRWRDGPRRRVPLAGGVAAPGPHDHIAAQALRRHEAPRPIVRYVSPEAISPDGEGSGNQATLRFDGPSRRRTLAVFHSRLGALRLVARRSSRSGNQVLHWDGKVGLRGRSRRAPSGNYLLMVRTRDAAGNADPPRPPTRVRVDGHPGARVRYIEARGPLRPAASGRPRRIRRFERRTPLPLERAAPRFEPGPATRKRQDQRPRPARPLGAEAVSTCSFCESGITGTRLRSPFSRSGVRGCWWCCGDLVAGPQRSRCGRRRVR